MIEIMLALIMILVLIICVYKALLLVSRTPHKLRRFNYQLKLVWSDMKTVGLYALFSRYLPIAKKTLLFESHLGNPLGGNPYYLLLELLSNSTYDQYQCVVVGKMPAYFPTKYKNDRRIRYVKYQSIRYLLALSTAKYLINDVTFRPFFIKRDEQIYLNTWHGTPLKAMGRFIKYSPVFLANTQRNFIQSDLLLSPNDHTTKMYKQDYMLQGLGDKRLVLSGYPRNRVFFQKSDKIRHALSLEDAKIICYMPTWRNNDNPLDITAQAETTLSLIETLSEKLRPDYHLFIKLHPLTQAHISLDKYKNVHLFPEQYEAYALLNEADMLITDYSSVLFDFANSHKKITLYCDDYDEFAVQRGFSLDYFADIPFNKVSDTDELLTEIHSLESNENIFNSRYQAFVSRFCPNDSAQAANHLMHHLLQVETSPLTELQLTKDPNLTLIFTGQFLRNGITSAFKNLMSHLDLNKHHIVCHFFAHRITPEHYPTITQLDPRITYQPITTNFTATPLERLYLYFNDEWNKQLPGYDRLSDRLYKKEIKRLFGRNKFDNLIHFTGYDRIPAELYLRMEGKKSIYVHNNMKKEWETRHNYHPPTLMKAWQNFDAIALVRESLKGSCLSLKGSCLSLNSQIASKLKVVHNCINIEEALQKKEADVNQEVKDINVLNDIKNNHLKKFITIGRFSPEKGHERLIYAFENIYKEMPNVALFIIGGHGLLYNQTAKRIQHSSAQKHIHLITSVNNPYAILKHMDAFILSSYYEGLPMVIFEALLMGLPVISTNIDGPAQFLQQGYGHIVSNNVSGLERGMRAYICGDIQKSDKNLKEFNEKAINEFYSLLQ